MPESGFCKAAPFQVIIDAKVGNVIEARELGSCESTDPAIYARNEAWSRKKAIICVVIDEEGWAHSARRAPPKNNPALKA